VKEVKHNHQTLAGSTGGKQTVVKEKQQTKEKKLHKKGN